MGLFTMHNCCASCLLDYLKSEIKSKSRLPIPQFSGYHCNKQANRQIDRQNLLNIDRCKRSIWKLYLREYMK